ncbi:MAG: AbrB family transcriptional regulator [Thermoprotei archaeon]|nr:MAG: AbrB family transcriptional regulator [Thermoprotei archaeon]
MNNLVKVTRNYQITVPATVREKLGIKEGDLVRIVYDESEGVAKIMPVKKKRITVRLGRKISVEEIEELIEEALNEATS